LFVLIFGFFIYQFLLNQANKKSFDQARITIDSIYNSAVSNLGKPDASKNINSCGNNQCTVYTSFVYGVKDEDQANQYFSKIQDSIKSHPEFKNKKTLSMGINSSLNGFNTAQDLYSYKKLTCTAKYTYDPPQVTLLKVKSTLSKPLYVEVGCSGIAKSAYY